MSMMFNLLFDLYSTLGAHIGAVNLTRSILSCIWQVLAQKEASSFKHEFQCGCSKKDKVNWKMIHKS